MTDDAGPRPQTLLVPFAQKDEARRLGARWDGERRAWTTDRPDDPRLPRRWLPLRDRPGVDPPYIRINLIPQSSWGRNLRAVMSPDEWRSFARDHVYATTGSLCLVCGERGPKWPVEADEVWRFDEQLGIQKLVAVVPLCPGCHLVRTVGHATVRGMGDVAIDRLSWIERIGIPEARRRIDQAMTDWARRSRRRWTIDVSIMKERYGMDIRWDEAAADAANREIIEDARSRRG